MTGLNPIQTGSYHIECAHSADVACDHLRGVYTVSFPELEVLTLCEKKGTRPIDMLPAQGVSRMARIQHLS